MPAPLVVINAVGLTERWLPHAQRLHGLAQANGCMRLKEVIPAVTCTAQAAVLTGKPAREHGIVGNGWLWRETGEIRFWQQSNRLLQAEPLYQIARRRAKDLGRSFRSAQLFWWFNQGAAVDISITPKPYYGADGNKVFGISGTPEGMCGRLEKKLGPFPFASFWGPMAGLACSQWIGRAAAEVISGERPDLTLVYLPHLDYDPQRFGPRPEDMPGLARELDNACMALMEAAKKAGARVWVLSEYGHVPVRRAVLPNRELRRIGMLNVRQGPFGDILETFSSRAFAVCDHQLAHIYVRDATDVPRVRDVLAALPGIARVFAGEEKQEINLDHSRSGELIALAEVDAWFAYPFWLDDRQAPDYARTVDIHRKPGYDPCELFFDPALWWPKGRAIRRLLQKKLGFRTLFDVVPLDATLVRGSHGLAARATQDQPLLIGAGKELVENELSLMEVHQLILKALDFA